MSKKSPDRVAEGLSDYIHTGCKIAVFCRWRFSAQLHCGVPAITSRLSVAFSSNLPSAAAPLVATSSTKQQYTASRPITASFFLAAPLAWPPGTRSPYKFHAALLDQYQSQTAPSDARPDLRADSTAEHVGEIDTPARPLVVESLTVAPYLTFPCMYL